MSIEVLLKVKSSDVDQLLVTLDADAPALPGFSQPCPSAYGVTRIILQLGKDLDNRSRHCLISDAYWSFSAVHPPARLISYVRVDFRAATYR